MIKVIKPGLQTTVQDQGRVGMYEIGMPPSGAMDKFSFTVANLLAGNQPNAAVLEITYMGPALQFEKAMKISLTGGNIPPKINGQAVPMWETLQVQEGDTLTFDFVQSGARTYLAVEGGIDVPVVMNSRSTYTLIGIGGYQGRALAEGDVLAVGEMKQKDVPVGTKIDPALIPIYEKTHEIRVVVGLCSYRLTEESLSTFLESEWTVTPEANRIGYRHKGERLKFVDREQPFGAGSNPSNVTDLGYPIGSIQVPDGVEPIVLLHDAVTGGGYATIATVISTDLNRMAQIKTNEKVRFRAVSLSEALEARQQLKQQLQQIADNMAM
ncbi:biotin-dependent carboxyltransferase family protein [Brevibacillus ruminantium]|uniref:Biotin-dependent carboxyltransferase family protein n=1 Tax=Brevibacillus ruminantium TaxID=2950604 RepID=A0ABY4W932_9BACL|nr:biotin-dependent carboxyltransferase family protein [Brevibacillus ruminantium]USG63361.1 biotin-dependent carboxyltransferase family protein [Brevibacillus ruminantium]